MRNVVFLAFFGLIGCEDRMPAPGALDNTVTTTDRFNLNVAITKGNHSYIPINRRSKPSEMAAEILDLVDAFQKKHPELIVTSFGVEKQQSAYGTSRFIYGLWLHHEEVDDRECCDCESDEVENQK